MPLRTDIRRVLIFSVVDKDNLTARTLEALTDSAHLSVDVVLGFQSIHCELSKSWSLVVHLLVLMVFQVWQV